MLCYIHTCIFSFLKKCIGLFLLVGCFVYFFLHVLYSRIHTFAFQLASLVVQQCTDDGKNCQPCDPQNSACYRSVTFPAQWVTLCLCLCSLLFSSGVMSVSKDSLGLTFTWWGCCGLNIFWCKTAELARSFLFCSWRLFLSLRSFQLYFFPWILPTTLHFLTLFFRCCFCLIGLFNFVFFSKVLCRILIIAENVFL